MITITRNPGYNEDPDRPVRVFKYVEPKYAAAIVKRGQFFIGTPEYYADGGLGAQADPFDSASARVLDFARINSAGDFEEPTDADLLAGMRAIATSPDQFGRRPHTIAMRNIYQVSRVSGYILCFCRSSGSLAFPGKTAIIEISDVRVLLSYLVAANPEKLGWPYGGGRVRYLDVVHDARKVAEVRGNPLFKSRLFEGEDEERAMWPRETEQVPFVSAPFTPPPGLLRRVDR